MSMSSSSSPGYDPKQAQRNLQEALDLTALKEQEFKLQKKQEDEDETSQQGGRRIDSDEHQRNATTNGTDPQEMQPLLSSDKSDDPLAQILQQQRSPGHNGGGGAMCRTNSESTIGCYTAEFVNLMQGQHQQGAAWKNSKSSLGTINDVVMNQLKGSQGQLHRHNSKPDLVGMWWDKCPMLTSANDSGFYSLRRIGNSCPDFAKLQCASDGDTMYQNV